MASDPRPWVWVAFDQELGKEYIWFAHDCKVNSYRVPIRLVKWRLDGEKVKPSVHCLSCGFHQFLTLASPSYMDKYHAR